MIFHELRQYMQRPGGGGWQRLGEAEVYEVSEGHVFHSKESGLCQGKREAMQRS